jgi:HEAT repeat protein
MLPVTPATPVAAAADPQEIEDRIANLAELAMNNDADSLNLILASLTDANPQIRAAALEAVIQFNSPDAIPSLQAVLAKVELPQEKVDVQAAIDYLKLPSFSQTETANPQP